MHTLGVVTVTYNSGKVIDGFLNSLLRQTLSDFALYIVDNASSDDTLAKLTGYGDPRIHLIANSVNCGAAEGNNQGIQAALTASCETVLLINNDTEFDTSLLEQLVTGFRQYRCDMIAPKILLHDRPIIWSAGGGFNARRGQAAFLYGYGEADRGQFDVPRVVQHAPTTCLLLKKQVFDRVGFIDTLYFAYHEDTDFCYRAYRAGLTLMFLPSATLHHKIHSLTGGPFSNFMMRYSTRNRVYFLLKHFGIFRGIYYVTGYQLYLIFQLLSRKVGVSLFWLRQKAFIEGLRLWWGSASG